VRLRRWLYRLQDHWNGLPAPTREALHRLESLDVPPPRE
jgi:hypothetical protein